MIQLKKHANKAVKEILSLPISPDKKINEIKYISKTVLNFFEKR